MKNTLLFICIFLYSILGFAQDVSIEIFKQGFDSPLSLQHVNDGRLFVVEKGGKIKIIQADGTVNQIPFLDISSLVSNAGEQGLLGLAFHPDYGNNGYFFVNYTNADGDTQISRFSVSNGNPDVADSASEVSILSFDQPASNHNGGNLAFGPEGFLYIASGDGGGSGDPNNRAQDLGFLLGKILRIDIDTPSGGNSYSIPADNPFLGNPNARGEIWAYGLRNPWRFSFDFTDNTLWIADVGQGNREEINRANVTEGGLNYGWRCYEGTQPFNTQNCPAPGELTFPLAEYSHNNGNCSITGGYVYRGTKYADLPGLYFFADFCSGLIGTVDGSGSITEYGNFSGSWVSFGEDAQKELYIIDLGGSIYKIEGGELTNTEDFQKEETLEIFPNPSTEKVTFQLKNSTIKSIQIMDVWGRTVFFEDAVFKNKKSLSVFNLNVGVYFCKVTSDKGPQIVKKLIVKK
jgi:glucose/arabinose dehydrogenase